MIRYCRYIILILVIQLCYKVKGQDPQFSQFYSNPLYLAPSFAGLISDTRLSGNYRVQWPQMPKPYTTFSLGIDHNFSVFNSGVGLYILKDVAGTGNLSTTFANLLYSYEFKISNFWYIRPGISFGYTERKIDFQELLWADQISVEGNSASSGELPPIQRTGDIDVSSSAMAYSDKFWFGFSADHLLKPNQSLYEYDGDNNTIGYIPVKYTVFGGTKLINKGRLINPYDASIQIAFLYKYQDEFNQLDMGLYWYHKPLVLGVWYRGMTRTKDKISRDALILLCGFKLDMINIGYSYDFTISRLINNTGGSHEFSLSYTFSTIVKKQKFRSVPCPDF